MPLFDRSTVPVQLTECGKKYQDDAEKIMDLEEELECYVGNLNDMLTGRLSIGGTYLFISFVLPGIIKKFRENFPQINLTLVERTLPRSRRRSFQGKWI